ncbi:MAG TPA: glycosyltransferase family 4 protein [Armatimonadota bacterium]|nr:glycosyltransferase family 4 protein [Armatimonadota bacterium]
MEAVARSSEAGAAAGRARVLLVAPPAEGGLATHVISLLRGLHRDGYHVGVACEPGGRIAAAAGERDLPVYGITCSAGGGPSRTAVRAVRLAQAIADFHGQIVHAHSFGASTIGAAACAIARAARLVVTMHNYPPGTDTMVPQRAGHRWAVGLALQRAHRVITVSEALRRDLVLAYPDILDKCTTIYNGVETHATPGRDVAAVRAELGLPGEGRLVGMVARLAPQKGVREFIRAARAVVDSWPSVTFVLAGDGPLMGEARELRAELGLEAHLHLVGQVDWARDLIRALEVLVVASLSEGSSVAAMEAMALGKPVVGTAVGGVPEVVADGQTGILVKPGDPVPLAAAIVELLSDPTRAEEMGERGRQRAAAHFDIGEMLERTKAVYADLVREEIESGSG